MPPLRVRGSPAVFSAQRGRSSDSKHPQPRPAYIRPTPAAVLCLSTTVVTSKNAIVLQKVVSTDMSSIR